MVGNYKFKTILWRYEGNGGWYFVDVGEGESKDIKANQGSFRRGFGSVPVRVTVGDTTWETSIFPDKKSGVYILPVKKSVRKAENLTEGEKFDMLLEVRE